MQGSTDSFIPRDAVLLKRLVMPIATGLLRHGTGIAAYGARARVGPEGYSKKWPDVAGLETNRLWPCS